MTTATGVHFDLTKKAEAFTFQLEKKGITKAPTMRVCGALDISGSMDDEIRDGSLQRVLDQLGGVAIKFDDNGEIDIWKFDNRSDYVGTWTPSDYQKYIRSAGIASRGGTAYSPFINDITTKMFECGVKQVPVEVKSGWFGGKKTEMQNVPDGTPKDNTPVLVLVITDGEPASESYNQIVHALENASAFPIFFAFVGVSNQGNGNFPTLNNLNKQFDNVGFVQMAINTPDDKLYEQIITDKLVKFIQRF